MNKHREQLQIDYFDLLAEPGDLSLERLVGDLDNLYTAPAPPLHLASLSAVLKETRTSRFMIPNYPEPEPIRRRRFRNWPRRGRPRPSRLVMAAMLLLLIVGGASFAIMKETGRYSGRVVVGGKVFATPTMIPPTMIPMVVPANYRLPIVPGTQEIEVNQVVANALIGSFLNIPTKCNAIQSKEAVCISVVTLPNGSRPTLRVSVSDNEVEKVRANTLKVYSSAGYLPDRDGQFYASPPLPDVYISSMSITPDPTEIFNNLSGVDKVAVEKLMAQLKGRKTVMFVVVGFGLQDVLKPGENIPLPATPVPASGIPPIITPVPGSNIERPGSPDAPPTIVR